MHLCAQEDKVNVAEILERHGAEIDPQTKACTTPWFTLFIYLFTYLLTYLFIM